jgi:glycosyltransferase involved in cell wall biosynthesis
MGQTPPPWHGQAVATQILFDHDWPDHDVHRLRMEFSSEMLEVGRFQWKKVRHLFDLISKARRILKENPRTVLLYPPASAKWVPFLRDMIFLLSVRHLAGGTVFIFHASGLPLFVNRGPIRRMIGCFAYGRAEVSLEVAKEEVPPHQVFKAKTWKWCPCGIDVPSSVKRTRQSGTPFTSLFVGSLQEGKGVLEILKTAKVLKDRGLVKHFHFRIVGRWFSTEFEQETRALRSELQVEAMVEIVGELTGDEKWQTYANADVFFFPTHYASEATPIVLMEALGMGLPLVSTRWAGIPAMLEGCKTAVLVPVRSPVLFADALHSIFSNSQNESGIRNASRKFYEENFLPSKFIQRIENAFHDTRNHWNAPHARSVAVQADDKTLTAETHVARPPIPVCVYLADQNPGYDRSFGISRMSQVVLEAMHLDGRIEIETITSRTSQQPPAGIKSTRVLPWGTRSKIVRLFTDHFHPLFCKNRSNPHLYYFPKGYLPLMSIYCSPSVVTIHDTIIQYDEDHYPDWRHSWEYSYWAKMLKHTLKKADRIMTVSEVSKKQILTFMERHEIPLKPITVTYEPCLYEKIPQPVSASKENYVIHLASREPHKRTAHLIRWWFDAETKGIELPTLHLIGTVPPEVSHLLAKSHSIVRRPFLADGALQAVYLEARALILPSEIEGFGLPALEAYYLGTPVCYVKGTSVEEVLAAATRKGGFSLDDPNSLYSAIEEVMTMTATEVHECGLVLRERYSSEKIARCMLKVMEEVAG